MKERCRGLVRAVLKASVSTRAGLRATNLIHSRLPRTVRRRLFFLCADEYWRVEGHWLAQFAGRRLVLPLSRDFQYGWFAAIAFDSYDPEMHDLYAALVRCATPPRVFFDVGANYGLHSLRLLAHGVRVVSFEPNPLCHAFFTECCRVNGLTPDIEPVAVGEISGLVDLAVPDDRTWLGSTIPDVWEEWRGAAIQTWSVRQVSLDAYIAGRGLAPDLLKIDVEGGEAAVLRGATWLLTTVRPTVIFESWPLPSKRAELHAILDDLDYGIATVAMGPEGDALMYDQFLTSAATNFIARPKERVVVSLHRDPVRDAAMRPLPEEVVQHLSELVAIFVAL
jgi:FkbM family methyltransferase